MFMLNEIKDLFSSTFFLPHEVQPLWQIYTLRNVLCNKLQPLILWELCPGSLQYVLARRLMTCRFECTLPGLFYHAGVRWHFCSGATLCSREGKFLGWVWHCCNSTGHHKSPRGMEHLCCFSGLQFWYIQNKMELEGAEKVGQLPRLYSL